MIHQRTILKAVAYAILLCFTSLTGAQPLYAIPANTQVPTGGQVMAGEVNIPKPTDIVNNTMNIVQESQTSVIKWDNFSIGADATVNFVGANGQNFNGFNSFNYVNGGNVSEIYGQLNAIGGNIFIANPSGVQIGNSAQINVGSLYATTKDFTNDLEAIAKMNDGDDIRNYLSTNGTITNPAAELMSLGSITSATNVTFDGGRIVLDTDRLFTSATGTAGETPMDIFNADNSPLTIRTNDEKNVVLGYTAYESDSPDEVGTFDTTEKKFNNLTVAVVNEDNEVTEKSASVNGYMWVEDVFQLQAMDNYIDGWFALRNAIDANYTASSEYAGLNGQAGNGFTSIGTAGNAFTGRFDGLGYNIFGLTINRGDEKNVGLFGSVGDGAIIRNVTLNGGSITGGTNVGSIAGSVSGSATIENITNTADVTGTTNVGGVIGSLDGTSGTPDVHGFANSGTVSGVTNVGGIVGEAGGVTLDGKIYNIGAVVGIDDEANNKWSSNIGGIVGHATNTTIGSSAFQIYNQLDVTGGWNVGGIVGFIEGDSTITNVANYGDVTATRYTTETYSYHNYDDNEWKDISINNVTVANAGGIAGKSGDSDSNSDKITINISNVENHGDVTTEQDNLDDGTKYYIAGNVGGIVGRAQYTDITNAENTENLVAGAHNVGGIAGYLNEGKIDTAGNNGGEITATGARSANSNKNNGFVQETVNVGGEEAVNIGNIGGIVGYLQGNAARITNAANRGDVHSAYIDEDATAVPQTAEAANAGGVVGKVSMKAYTDDMNGSDLLAKLQDEKYDLATISNSYNTGNVAGYTGVGGVAGQMVKGSVAGSYNLGTVRSTRIADPGTVQPLNMGGIVGDTSVATDGSGTVIYDVYNAGQIGDDTYTYLGRHVGGVVGRLGGTLEKAYNTGDIYNGYSVTGGVVGYWVSGNIKNVFNTGNVTVVNKDLNARNSLVGGIVGAALSTNDKTLSYAYNLGTLRSFIPKEYERIELSSDPIDGTPATVDAEKYTPQEIDSYQWIVDNVIFDDGDDSTQGGKYDSDKAYQLENINVVGGIIGGVTETPDGTTAQKNVTISNVYTTGNIYAGRWNAAANEGKGGYTEATKGDTPDRIGAIWGTAYTNGGDNVDLSDSYFIKPLEKPDVPDAAKYTDVNNYGNENNENLGYQTIEWDNRMDSSQYENFTNLSANGLPTDNNSGTDGWRMYSNDPNGMQTLPMLNAFTPNSAKDQSWKTGVEGIGSVQYGTAANPLLTIINAEKNTDGTYKDVELNWSTLGISGAGSLAVYDGNLTINGFSTTLGSYFNGIIFSDGDLTINANGDGDAHNLGSGSRVYGTSVNFNAGTNDTTLYGSVTSTNGDINISGGNVSVIGSLTSSKKGQATQVEGIAKNGNTADSGVEAIKMEDLKNPDAEITTVEKAYSYMANASEEHPTTAPTVENGSIKVEASGSAEVLYGNMKDGRIDAAENFTVKGKESVYIDSDLHIGGDLNLNSDGEIVLDLSNMGSYDSVNEKGETITGKENLHRNFLDHFKNAGAINVRGEGADGFMIALDMWEEADPESGKTAGFDLDKYDVSDGDYDNAKAHELAADIKKLKISLNDEELNDNGAQEHTFIWIDGAEQLNGIQAYKDANDASKILTYNFALKDNIDASQIVNYKPIASGTTTVTGDDGEETKVANAFTGTFDGRGFAIIGLNANMDESGSETHTQTDAGIFGTVGAGGTVQNLNVYSSHFTGDDTAGAIAGKNYGEITGITTLGNKIRVTGTKASTTITRGDGAGNDAGATLYAGAAGGIAGVNAGSLSHIHDVNVSDTVIASEASASDYEGSNEYITVAGGVAGINYGIIGDFIGSNPPSAGVVSTSAVITDVSPTADSESIMHGLGGVVGINEFWVYNVAALGATNGSYGMQGSSTNEYVGGIIGINYSPIVNLVYNESAVIGASNVGGIVGKNEYRGDTRGEISYAVNAGDVTAITDILGVDDENVSYAGGLAGSNYGEISGGRNTGTVTGINYVGGMVGLNAEGATLRNLSNAIAAEISGVNYVGGIAGRNDGTITAASGLVNEGKITGNQYVGGIAGENTGTIQNVVTGMTLKSTGTDAQYFGGVTGSNSGTITDATNTGTVTADGATLVGGITGENKTKDDGTGGVLENAGNSGDVSGLAQVGGVAGKNSSTNVEGTIVNSGNVTAGTDGAAGIFYVNEAKLDGITLRNDGTVSVTGAADDEIGTGGVIGINKGEIINSTLTNNSNVTGNDNTGGLIGINNADISYSTLISTVNSHVKGQENTGGLIGKNTGLVKGGRNDADTMYEHKIYNNGGVHGTGDNTGGLIGKNEGTLTAGYNTGSVMGQNNVGGVVGTNNGTISEVFNTIMTGEETGNNVSGAGNAGGIVGNNAQNGILTDAYNTTAVESQGTKGNAVGENSGTVENVYAANTDGKLVGSNNGTVTNSYTFSAEDETDGVTMVTGDAQKQSGSYEGFGFGSAWKNYDYWTTPMLKVFLTKGEYKDGVVTAADGLAAFGNANSLIVFVPDPATGGMFMTVYSSQIASSLNPDGTFNPNNLGYDLEGFSVYMGINNGHLHSDGWDRLRNFRERKAELYFHEGGMEYAEEM